MKKLEVQIGQKVASIRNRRGYSQAQLADLVKVTTEDIQIIELGQSELGDKFNQILHAIKIALDAKDDFENLFVNIEQAKKLRKLSFNEDVSYIADISPLLTPYNSSKNSLKPKEYVKVPTQEQALEWILKNYKLQIIEYYRNTDLAFFANDSTLNLCLGAITLE